MGGVTKSFGPNLFSKQDRAKLSQRIRLGIEVLKLVRRQRAGV